MLYRAQQHNRNPVKNCPCWADKDHWQVIGAMIIRFCFLKFENLKFDLLKIFKTLFEHRVRTPVCFWPGNFPLSGSLRDEIMCTQCILHTRASYPSLGYVRTQNISKPTPKHPLSWPKLENGQIELSSGQLRPQLGKMFET